MYLFPWTCCRTCSPGRVVWSVLWWDEPDEGRVGGAPHRVLHIVAPPRQGLVGGAGVTRCPCRLKTKNYIFYMVRITLAAYSFVLTVRILYSFFYSPTVFGTKNFEHHSVSTKLIIFFYTAKILYSIFSFICLYRIRNHNRKS